MKANRLMLAGAAVSIACVSAWLGVRYGSRGGANVVAEREKGDGVRRRAVSTVSSPSRAVRARAEPRLLPDESAAAVLEVVEEDVVPRSKYEEEVSAIAAELAAAIAADDESVVAEIRHNLAVYRKQTLLNALRGLVRHGTPEQRRNALYALALSFGSGSSKIRTSVSNGGEMTRSDDADLGVIGDGLPESSDELEREARRTHDIVCAVGDGLEDNDSSVRQAAFDAMLALRSEDRSVLSQQVLTGDNVELKRNLLSEIAGSEDSRDLMLSISALEDEDPSVRASAEANVKSATGQDFKTQDEAFAWVESQTDSAVAAAVSEVEDSKDGGVASTPEEKE